MEYHCPKCGKVCSSRLYNLCEGCHLLRIKEINERVSQWKGQPYEREEEPSGVVNLYSPLIKSPVNRKYPDGDNSGIMDNIFRALEDF